MHLTEIIKNVRSEVHLCESCAREIGLNSKLSSYAVSVPDMVSFLDNDADEVPGGESLPDFAVHLRPILKPADLPDVLTAMKPFPAFLKSVYSDLKIPYGGGNGLPKKRDLASEPDSKDEPTSFLIEQLDDAVNDERYEEAAKLRDMIRGRR